MKTLERCQNCKIGNSVCVFAQLEKRKIKGREFLDVRETETCVIGRGDTYNLYPYAEVNKSGYICWHHAEQPSSDPLAISSSPYNFENMSSHNTMGDAYDLRRHDYPSPTYHEIDYNVPTNKSGHIAPDAQATLVGHKNFHLVTDNWHEDGYGQPKKIIGMKYFDPCYGLYGMVDKKGIVIHKSMRSNYENIPGWVNYTKQRYKKQKEYNIFISSPDDIERICTEKLTSKRTQGRLLDAYEFIKTGTYINVYDLFVNNKTPVSENRAINNAISTKNPSDLYRYNPVMLLSLYRAISRGKIECSKQDRKLYLSNIINYVLNDPYMSQVMVGQKTYNSSDRYWNSIEIVINGIKDNLVKQQGNGYVLPEWFQSMMNNHVSHNIVKDTSVHHIDQKEDDEINPAVQPVRKLLKINNEGAYIDFTNIQRCITKITPQELQAVWNCWEYAKSTNDPVLFWDYIKEYANGNDLEDICHLSTLENPTNWATQIYDICISHHTFDTYKVEEEFSPYWQVPQHYNIENMEEEGEEQWLRL